jgi:L-ascorbate metabolism protein UlaG (beta-lactamase superfamily)
MVVTLTWHGHSAFEVVGEDAHILIDPFISENPTATADPTDLHPTTILLTHAHNDHVGDTVSIARRTGAKVIATAELADWLGEQGVEHAAGGNHGGTVTFAGGSAKFVPAWHTSSYTTPNGVVAPGVPAGFVVRIEGLTVYFAGDTGLFLDMQLIGEEELDVAILPIGDNFTMGPTDALRATRLLKPNVVIPCHYNTFPLIEQDATAFKTGVEAATDATVVLPEIGVPITLSGENGPE